MGHGAAICPTLPGHRLTAARPPAPGKAARVARWLHDLFEASLVLKGALAMVEALAGLVLWLLPHDGVPRLVHWLAEIQLVHHRVETMAAWAEARAAEFSISSQHFYALYLLSHGGLKIGLVLALARGYRWAYPAAMVLLAAFIAYQMHHWAETRAPVLLFLSGFDAVMIWLVLQEWIAVRRREGQAPGPA